MLLRDVQEAHHGLGGKAAWVTAPLMSGLADCQRFVFTEHASRAVEELAKAPLSLMSARAQIFAPFPKVWIEFKGHDGERHGLLWVGAADEPQCGLAWVTRNHKMPGIQMPMPFKADIAADTVLVPIAETEKRFAIRGSTEKYSTSADWAAEWAPLMLASFALIASNGVSHTVEADLTKLNAARQKRGVWPLMAYKEVRLTLDAEQVVLASRGTATGTMPLHPVRAHLRVLPSGKVTIVRAHMRGDAKNGIRHHHYTVQTSDDMAA